MLIHTVDAAKAIQRQGSARAPRLLALLPKGSLGPTLTQKAGQRKYCSSLIEYIVVLGRSMATSTLTP